MEGVNFLHKTKEKARRPAVIALLGVAALGPAGIWGVLRIERHPEVSLQAADRGAAKTVGKIVLAEARAEAIPGNIKKDMKHRVVEATINESDGKNIYQIVVKMHGKNVVSKDVKTGRITEDLKAEPATTFKVFEVERDSSGKEMKTALAIINNADKTGKDGWALRYSDISGEHPINHKHFIKSENASVDDSYAVAGHAVLSAYSTAALHSPVQPETSNSSQPNDSYAAPGLLMVQMEKREYLTS